MNKKTKEISKPSSRAIGKMIRISPYKLNLEAKSIRGKKVDDALSYLEILKKENIKYGERHFRERYSKCRK